MRERDIFIAAMEIDDPAVRTAYLEKQCVDDFEILARIQRLLNHAQNAGEFLEKPAADLCSDIQDGPFTSVESLPCEEADSTTSTQTANVRACETANTFVLNPASTGDPTASNCLPTSPREPSPVAGTLFGRYRIDRVLGSGGMGTVYLAEDLRLGRRVALKIPRFDVDDRHRFGDRFKREARTMASVMHRNLCPIFDVDEQDGIQYLTMAYVEGETLSQLLNHGTHFPPRQVATWIRGLAMAIDAAHRAGIVHRDLKPANVILDREGEPVLMDFGLAWIVHESDSRVTQEGIILGTPAYMSPEQAEQESGVVGPASDIYSLGAILFELLTGRPIYTGNVSRVIYKLIHEPPPRPCDVYANVDPTLEQICCKAISRRPEDRFASAEDFAAALTRFLESNRDPFPLPKTNQIDPIAVPNLNPQKIPADKTEKERSPAPRFNSLMIRISLVGLVLIGIIGFAWSFLANPKNNKHVATVQPAMNQVPKGKTVPETAIAPFDSSQAKAYQEAWSKYLDVPVEFTNSIGMTFVLIPPGEFMMGSTQAEIESAPRFPGEDDTWYQCSRAEAPQHQVILTKPFYMATHETTQVEYTQVLGRNPSMMSAIGDLRERVAGLDTSDFPVDTVNWNEAMLFCETLSRREKIVTVEKSGPTDDSGDVREEPIKGYRLPTEAEWEFACRAGTTSRFSSGDDIQEFNAISWNGATSDHRIHSVEKLRANSFGLFDMHGNVWEWVQDRWDPVYYQRFIDSPAIDPPGSSADSSRRVVRGGFWATHELRCISSRRFAQSPLERYGHNGFRVVLDVDKK